MLSPGTLWQALLAAYVIFMLVIGVFFYSGVRQRFAQDTLFITGHEQECKAVDFVHIYACSQLAKRCLTDRDCFLYDAALQTSLANSLISPVTLGAPRRVEYPPFFYTVILPLCLFTMKGAWIMWTACNALMLLAALIIVSKQESLQRKQQIALMVFAFSSGPVMYCLAAGQTAIWLAIGLLIFSLALERQKYFVAAVATAVGIVKIQYLPFLLVWAFLLGKFKYVLGLTVSYAVVLLSCMLIFGPSCVIGYPGVILLNDGLRKSPWATMEYMENVRGQLYHWLPVSPSHLFAISALLMIVGVLAVAFLWFKSYPALKRSDPGNAFKLCAALSIFIMLGFSLHTYAYDYLAGIPALVWLYQWARQKHSEWTLANKPGQASSLSLYKFLELLILFCPLIAFLTTVVQQQNPGLVSWRFFFLLDCLLLTLSAACIFSPFRKSPSALAQQLRQCASAE